jgi:hypothetical protein
VRNNFRTALVFSLAMASMAGQSRAAVEILSEFDRLQFPSNSIGGTPAAFEKKVDLVATRKGELAFELHEQSADHARVGELLRDRCTPAMAGAQNTCWQRIGGAVC